MIIDTTFCILIALAVYKGYNRGLIIAALSFVAVIIGLLAAVKLSAVAANFIGKPTNVPQQWLPTISFILVFIAVLLLIKWSAKALDKVAEIAMIGWINKLGGIILYLLIYTTILSFVLLFSAYTKILSLETIQKSVCYPFIEPWGPAIINNMSKILPFLKGILSELDNFFNSVSRQAL